MCVACLRRARHNIIPRVRVIPAFERPGEQRLLLLSAVVLDRYTWFERRWELLSTSRRQTTDFAVLSVGCPVSVPVSTGHSCRRLPEDVLVLGGWVVLLP